MAEKEVESKEENNDLSPQPKSQAEIESEEKERQEKIKQKQNKQLMWAIFLMISVIVIIISVPYIRDNVFNKFNYNGMTFQKTMFGQLVFYNTKLPLFSQPGSTSVGTGLVIEELQNNRKQTGSYELSLRQDPRILDNIKVDLDINNITFIKSNTVYVTYNASDPICEHNVISAADLARFLIYFGNLKAEGSTVSKEYGKANNIPYITCENNPENTVINMVAGDESKIFKVKDNCYELMYANCDILGVTNKFILTLAEGYLNNVNGNTKNIKVKINSTNKSL